MKIKSLWMEFLKRRHKYDELRDYLKPTWKAVVFYLVLAIIVGFMAYCATNGILWVLCIILIKMLFDLYRH